MNTTGPSLLSIKRDNQNDQNFDSAKWKQESNWDPKKV